MGYPDIMRRTRQLKEATEAWNRRADDGRKAAD